MKVIIFRGRIYQHGTSRVHIYVKGEEGRELRRYIGKEVKGLLVIEDESA